MEKNSSPPGEGNQNPNFFDSSFGEILSWYFTIFSFVCFGYLFIFGSIQADDLKDIILTFLGGIFSVLAKKMFDS